MTRLRATGFHEACAQRLRRKRSTLRLAFPLPTYASVAAWNPPVMHQTAFLGVAFAIKLAWESKEPGEDVIPIPPDQRADFDIELGGYSQ